MLQRTPFTFCETDVHFPSGKVTVTVEDGLLTLEGTVEWNFQREATERAVQRIRGVKAMAHTIEVAPAASTRPTFRKGSRRRFVAAPRSTRGK